MAQAAGGNIGHLPESVAELLDGTQLGSKEGVTLLLATVGESGWPHIAMLSVGELVATSPHDLFIALWPSSRTTAGLTRNGKATLSLIHRSIAYRIQIDARRLDDLDVFGRPLALFAANLVDVSEDAVGYAELVSGVVFKLIDPEAVIPRWEATVAAMLERAADQSGRQPA